jgi:hypothetical protein
MYTPYPKNMSLLYSLSSSEPRFGFKDLKNVPRSRTLASRANDFPDLTAMRLAVAQLFCRTLSAARMLRKISIALALSSLCFCACSLRITLITLPISQNSPLRLYSISSADGEFGFINRQKTPLSASTL